jgi:hypothetical protein
MTMGYSKAKVRRNLYMGQEYLDLEAVAVNERKRTGRKLSVSDLIRKACREYVDQYWARETTRPAKAAPKADAMRAAEDV